MSADRADFFLLQQSYNRYGGKEKLDMGYFTWTDACRKPKKNKYGDYTKASKIAINGYDGYVKVVCPDNTVIEEQHYHGYGMFGSHDIFDLVVDWNKDDLPAIFARKKKAEGKFFGRSLADAAEMLATGKSDAEISEYIKKEVFAGRLPEYLIDDWKRTIGIAIACEDKDNKSLKYPIKITSTRKNVKYEDMGVSLQTQ